MQGWKTLITMKFFILAKSSVCMYTISKFFFFWINGGNLRSVLCSMFCTIRQDCSKQWWFAAYSSLAQENFTIVLAVGLEILSLCNTWKPISKTAIHSRLVSSASTDRDRSFYLIGGILGICVCSYVTLFCIFPCMPMSLFMWWGFQVENRACRWPGFTMPLIQNDNPSKAVCLGFVL